VEVNNIKCIFYSRWISVCKLWNFKSEIHHWPFSQQEFMCMRVERWQLVEHAGVRRLCQCHKILCIGAVLAASCRQAVHYTGYPLSMMKLSCWKLQTSKTWPVCDLCHRARMWKKIQQHFKNLYFTALTLMIWWQKWHPAIWCRATEFWHCLWMAKWCRCWTWTQEAGTSGVKNILVTLTPASAIRCQVIKFGMVTDLLGADL